MSPRATVLIPTYNRAATLAQTVATLAPQAADARIVVLDDASSDHTADICREAAGHGIEYIRHIERKGLFANWNAGLAVVRTEYVAIYHDDDVYGRDIVGRSIAALDRHPSATFVHTACHYVDDDGMRLGCHTAPWPPLIDGRRFRREMAGRFSSPIVTPSVMMRTEAVRGVGGFDERLRVCSDYVMWLELARRGDVAFITEPMMDWRRRGRFANEHASVNWEIIGEQVGIGTAAQSEIIGRLGPLFRLRRAAYLAQFVARDALEPAPGNRAAVLDQYAPRPLRAGAAIARPGGAAAPLLKAARPVYRVIAGALRSRPGRIRGA
jgi:glycosyltransferase involved in cell wall biosynthesis